MVGIYFGRHIGDRYLIGDSELPGNQGICSQSGKEFENRIANIK
jgi:hypothetical protein